jgi:hypothetical protein
MRPPSIAGVGGGVATTTLAVALRGRDAGRAPDAADIIACRGRPDSLRRAAAVLERTGPGPRPVLAVTLDGSRAPRGPVRARLDQLAAVASAVVLLPDVGRWRTIADPLPEVATLLVQPREHLPRPLRTYAAALGELAAAVAASGRLASAPDGAGRAAQAAGAPAAPLPPAVSGSPAPRRPPRRERATPATVLPDRAAVDPMPRVVGAHRPVVGSVTRVDPPSSGASRLDPTRPDTRPSDGGRPTALRPERPEPAAPVTARTARRPRGVRIVSPAPSRPAAVPASGHSTERQWPGDRPSVPVERIEQVG